MNPTPSSPSSAAPRILEPARCIWPAGTTLGEGTLWSVREQALYWVDIHERRLFRLDPASGARSNWLFDEEISALAERENAPGLVVSLRRGLALFDPADGAPPRYLHRPGQEAPGNRFNDGKCDPQGRFWGGSMDIACEQPTGALYRFDPAGGYSREVEGVTVSNGPTWSPDGRTMHFNDTAKGLSWVYDFDAVEGRPSNRRLWARFGHDQGYPDGMTTDAAGRIWIAHWGGACVSCHDPETAAELCRIPLPTRHITNCAFGGADLRTLFITSARSGLSASQLEAEPLAGGLFAARIDGPGMPAALFGG